LLDAAMAVVAGQALLAILLQPGAPMPVAAALLGGANLVFARFVLHWGGNHLRMPRLSFANEALTCTLWAALSLDVAARRILAHDLVWLLPAALALIGVGILGAGLTPRPTTASPSRE
jgi:hypothetical protein